MSSKATPKLLSSKATPQPLFSKATPQPLSSKASRGCTVDVQPWMHLIPLLLWSTRAALFLCLPAGRRPWSASVAISIDAYREKRQAD